MGETLSTAVTPAPETAAPIEWVIEPRQVAYPDAIASMQSRIAAIRTGAANERVWLLEHPPLYTAGTSAKPADLAAPGRFETFDAGRGGQWTYHGPGQLVGYVMLDLMRPHGGVPPKDTHAYVAGLEAWLIATLARFGVAGERREGRVGVWVRDEATGADEKIAAIGVRITRWVTWHGVSLNVCPDLEHFSGIVPCGIREHGVTSLKAQGLNVTISDVQREMRTAWPDTFGPVS